MLGIEKLVLTNLSELIVDFIPYDLVQCILTHFQFVILFCGEALLSRIIGRLNVENRFHLYQCLFGLREKLLKFFLI